MEYVVQLALTYDDVLLIPQYSEVKSRRDVEIWTNITPKIRLKIPLIAVNMDSVVGIEMAGAMYRFGGVVFYPRFKPVDEQAKEVDKLIKKKILVVPAVGIKSSELVRVDKLYEVGVRCITIDVAHGHQKTVVEFIKTILKKYPDLEVIAGVVATYEGARDLFEAGACTVRVGVGPGTICTTRQMTGFGIPQITATLEAVRAAKEFKDKRVLTDGGTKQHGDIVKALACGASAVVVGSQFAGCEETPGEILERDGKKYKRYNASTSETEKKKQFALNPQDKNEKYTVHIEGLESLVPYKGPLLEVLEKMEASIRSGLAYAGAFNLKEFWEKARFVQVTPVSSGENGAHGVII